MLVVTGFSYAGQKPSITETTQSTNNIPSKTETPTEGAYIVSDQHKLQRLTVGEYQTRAEAGKIAGKIRQLGLETWIKQLNEGFVINAGAFSSTSNLEQAVSRLQKAGLTNKIGVVEVDTKHPEITMAAKPKKTRSTVFVPNVSNTQHKKAVDGYVPKQQYVKLEHEVDILKSQMQSLLDKLAVSEQDLNKKNPPESQAKTKSQQNQDLAMPSQAKEKQPVKVTPKKNNDATADTEVGSREKEAKESKRDLDTFLRGQKVLYKRGEFALDFNLAYNQNTAVNTFGFSPATTKSKSNAKVTSRSVNSSITMRYGIIDDLEFDLTVPYGYFEEEADNQPFNREFDTSGTLIDETDPVSHTDSVGIGDINGALRYTALSESGNIPTVTLNLNSQAPTGKQNGLGSGFWSMGGGVSLVKTIDPVVLFGSLGYTEVFEDRGIDPADQISYSIGTGYSMNDRVSFTTSLSGNIAGRTEINGIDRPGSSMDAHSLQLSTTIQLDKRLFVEPFVGFGLTKDASDFVVGLRLPYRFGERFPLPFLSD